MWSRKADPARRPSAVFRTASVRGLEVGSPRLLEQHRNKAAGQPCGPRRHHRMVSNGSKIIVRLALLSLWIYRPTRWSCRLRPGRINPAVADSSPPSHCRPHIASRTTAPQIAAQSPNDSDNTKISALLRSARTRPWPTLQRPARPVRPVALLLLPTGRKEPSVSMGSGPDLAFLSSVVYLVPARGEGYAYAHAV
jgi:hypothetical protein